MKSQMTKSERRIYNRDDMIRLFYCPKDIPDYLKEFTEILNDNVNDLWYKKPLPKFEENPDVKHKPQLSGNQLKARQRTTSNHSGENIAESEANQKYRTQTSYKEMKPRTDKFNRYNILNEPETTMNKRDHNGDSGWHTVESRPFKMLSKQYVTNNQGQDNHWKKWSKESGDKTKISSPFPRIERTNNFVVKKIEVEPKQDNIKTHASKSFSASSDQTEDIWQDDWETEMQSKIATTPEEPLESYELPPSSIAMSSSIPVHRTISVPSHNSKDTADYDLWFYKDLNYEIQGPFPSESMANWLATGYFDYSTCLRRRCDERFLLLAEYRALYGRIPFTVGATIPPILMDTNINIDAVQLTVGLDRAMIQKVLANATSLSPKISPYINTNLLQLDGNILLVNEVEKNALLEEERKLKESKADLERDRQRFFDEQEQWKIRMEKEMDAKMQLFMQQTMEQTKAHTNLTANTSNTSANVVESSQTPEIVELTESPVSLQEDFVEVMTEKEIPADTPVVTITVESANISEMKLNLECAEDLKGDDWVSMKDMKNIKKSKKSKNKLPKLSPEPQLPTPELKKNDKENVPRIIRESGNLRIIEREVISDAKKIEKPMETSMEKPEVISSWTSRPAMPKVEMTQKSLLEIQAEETEKAKAKQELEKAINLSRVEANKVTSFKESLLKSVKPVKAPLIPSGKSIWDVHSADSVVVDQVVRPVEPKVTTKDNKTRKPSEDYERVLLNNNNDALLSWCCQKLTKFSKDLDVFTVVELLRQVPLENVSELTAELLDDSAFSRNFARDFIKKREELSVSAQEEPWQVIPIVKKPAPITAQSTTKTAGGKTKSKKKMVVIDHTKFRSA